MPSLIKKKIKGKNYYYIVETQRVNGKPRITNQVYLGTAAGILQRFSGEKPFTSIKKIPAVRARPPRGIPQKNNQGRDTKKMITNRKTNERKIDLGAGQIALGGIFDGLGSLMEQISKLKEQVETSNADQILGMDKEGAGVFGFTIKTNLDGQPTIEQFGNIREGGDGAPTVQAVREPIVDVIEEKDSITVIAELPGVDDRGIKLTAQDDVLIIETTGERSFGKEISLPCPVDGTRLKRSYKNGILKATLPKTKKQPKRGS